MAAEPKVVHVGIDVGGTKMLCVVVDEQEHVLAQFQKPTHPWSQEIRDTAISLTRISLRSAKQRLPAIRLGGIGLGIPGMIDHHTGRVHQAVNLGSDVTDIRSTISTEFGVDTLVENDVNAAAMGVYHLLRNRPENLVFLNLGTGVAAGIILNGTLFHGASGVAGEIGHIPLDREGPLCQCGQQGCVETLISGFALSQIWPTATGYPGEELLREARSGKVEAQKAWRDFGVNVARTIQLITLTFDPADIFLGGGVSKIGDPLLEIARKGISQLEEGSRFLQSLDMGRRLHLVDPDVPVGALGAALLVGTDRNPRDSSPR
ncbi:MAG: ROK family protein [Bifidobacterium sp.]|jgi:glucokinase